MRNRGTFFPAREKRRASRISRARPARGRCQNREFNPLLDGLGRPGLSRGRSRRSGLAVPRDRFFTLSSRFLTLISRFLALQARETRDALHFSRAGKNVPRFLDSAGRPEPSSRAPGLSFWTSTNETENVNETENAKSRTTTVQQ